MSAAHRRQDQRGAESPVRHLSETPSDQCSVVLNATMRTGVAVLAGHQIVDGGFEIGFAEIGFRECRAKFPVIVDDDIKSLVVAVRHNRRGPAPTHRQYSTDTIPGI